MKREKHDTISVLCSLIPLLATEDLRVIYRLVGSTKCGPKIVVNQNILDLYTLLS